MTAPNLIGMTTVVGKTTGANLTSASATTILSNASGSGKCLKINTLNVANYGASPVGITINYYTGASLGGTAYQIVANVTIPATSTLNVIDKTSQYYLEENNSLGAIASTANFLTVTCSYEDIS
jgi:hypothetical protein